jgi:hypothetical protein
MSDGGDPDTDTEETTETDTRMGRAGSYCRLDSLPRWPIPFRWWDFVSERRQPTTPPVAIVMQRVSCTTIMAISNGLMCSTEAGPAGHINRSAFLTRQLARIGRHRIIPTAIVMQRVSCTTIMATSEEQHSHGAGRQLLPAGLPAKVM